MSKTDAEWRVLDEQLAREVMGWCQWHDIPQAERDSFLLIRYGGLVDAPYWDNSGQPSVGWTELTLATQQSFWWKKHPEYRWIHAEAIREWQPHVAVAQALMVLDRIVKIRRHGHSIFLLAPHLTRYRVLIWEGFGCVGIWRGEHASRAKAICLAIKAYLDAQKEAQDEPG